LALLFLIHYAKSESNGERGSKKEEITRGEREGKHERDRERSREK
jgi:hypothetical protein